MESYGDISTNCITIHIKSYIESILKNLILDGVGAGETPFSAPTEIPLSDFILTTGPRLQE
jgi:hypothetical protein